MSRASDAAALHERALEAQRRILGHEHPDTLTTMNNLALAYRDLGRIGEAATLQETVVEARSRILGVEHPLILSSIHSLAMTYWDSSQQSKAIDLFEHQLEICHKVHGAEHEETLRSTATLADHYLIVGRVEDAEKLKSRLSQALEHPTGAVSAELHRSTGQIDTYFEDSQLARTEADTTSTFDPANSPATATFDCTREGNENSADITEVITEESITELWNLVDKFPMVNEFQDRLNRIYTAQSDQERTISGWFKLVRKHPSNSMLHKRLSVAYSLKRDGDEEIMGWWMLLASYPSFSLLRRLKEACNQKYGSVFSRRSVWYFAWLCLLSLLDHKLRQWGLGESIWWPLADDDELMILRPYWVKSEWRCESTGINGTYWMPACQNATAFESIQQSDSGATDIADIELSSSHTSKLDSSKSLSVASGGNFSDTTARNRSPALSNPDDHKSPLYLHMLLCFSERLFHTLIEIQSDHIDDDKTVFKKMKESYYKARGAVGLHSAAHSLKGIRQVKTYNIEGRHFVNVIDELPERSDFIPPPQWRAFLMNVPDECTGKTFYRSRLPLGENVEATYGGTVCEAMRFEHAKNRGLMIVVGFLILSVAFLVGGIYGKVKDDVIGGFTIAGIMSLPLTLLTLCK